MAELTINEPRKAVARFLKVQCGVRYWEDATINGVKDEDGTLTPCRSGEVWAPTIDIDAGKVINWPEGVTASIHFKVCDDGRYTLCDEDMNDLRDIAGYVPAMLSPGGSGYSDYVIMEIGPDGLIADWKADLSYFEGE